MQSKHLHVIQRDQGVGILQSEYNIKILIVGIELLIHSQDIQVIPTQTPEMLVMKRKIVHI